VWVAQRRSLVAQLMLYQAKQAALVAMQCWLVAQGTTLETLVVTQLFWVGPPS
jgi:hypothetical protein